MQISSIGIDLGKYTFHLVALDEHSKVVSRQKFTRKQLLAFTANLPSSLIGMEACSGAHFLGAALRGQGHDVRLIPAQFVLLATCFSSCCAISMCAWNAGATFTTSALSSSF